MEQKATTRSIKTVVIGFGGFGRLRLLPAILKQGAFEIVGVVDPSEENRLEIGKLVGLAEEFLFPSTADTFSTVEADLAIIASNVESHYQNCIDALNAGCYVSVTKPFVNDLNEGVKLVELARQKKRWISVYQTERLSNWALIVKEYLENDKLGELAFGNIYSYRSRFPECDSYSLHEKWPAINACGIHQFDLYRYLLGKNISKVCFRGIDADWNPYDDPGVATGWFEFEGGPVISYFNSFISQSDTSNHAMLQGSNGTLFGNHKAPVTFQKRQGEKIEEVKQPNDSERDAPAQTVEYFQWLAEAINNNREIFADASDNLWSLSAIKAAELSAIQGGTIVEVNKFAREAGIGS